MMLRSLLTIGFLQVLTMVVMLGRTKGLALLLGPEMVGVMGVIDRLLAVISQTAALSLPFAAVRFLPARWARGQTAFRDLLGRMVKALLLLVGTATVVSLALTVLTPGVWGAELTGYRSILLAAFLALPTLALAPFLQNALAGRLQHNRAMIFSLGHAAVLTATSLLGVWWMGLAGFYALYAAAGVLLAWPVIRWLRRPAAAGMPAVAAGAPATSATPETPPVAPAPGGAGEDADAPPRFLLPWPVWRFCLFLLGLTFTSPFAALFVGYQMLGIFGAETTGWMQAALGIALAVRAVLGSAHPVFLTPNVNRDGTPAERLHWANEYQKTLACLIVVAVPPLLLFPHLAIQALYSSEFVPGAPFVFLFVLVEVVGLLAGTYQSLVIAQDRMGFHVAQNVTAQLLLIGVAAVLIPRHGIAGAALAGLAAQAFLYLATTLFLRHQYGLRVPPRNLILYGLMLASLLASGWLGAAARPLTPGSVALKGAAYAAVLALLAPLLTRQDRANLRGHLEALRARLRPAASR